MTNRYFSRISAIALISALGGCISLGGAETPASMFTLTASQSAPAGKTTSGSLANAIAITEPDAPQRLNVARVPVQVNDAEVAYLKDAVWVEKPTRLFRSLLAETIAARSNRLVIDGADPDLSAKTRLYGTLLDMGYDARSSSVIVRYEGIRDNGSGDIQKRRFESVVPGITPDAAAVGPALNQAANDVADQVAEWIG